MNGIEFYFNKKTFPRLQDRGLVDVNTIGAGAEVGIYWKVISSYNAPMRFVIKDAYCSLGNVDIRFRDVKHRFLLNTMIKLFRNTIKKKIELQIAKSLYSQGVNLESTLNNLSASLFNKIPRDPYYAQHRKYDLAPKIKGLKTGKGKNLLKKGADMLKGTPGAPIIGTRGLATGPEVFDVTVKVGTVGEEAAPIVFTAHNVTPGRHMFVEKGGEVSPSLSVSGMSGEFVGVQKPLSEVDSAAQTIGTGLAPRTAAPTMGAPRTEHHILPETASSARKTLRRPRARK